MDFNRFSTSQALSELAKGNPLSQLLLRTLEDVVVVRKLARRQKFLGSG